MVTLAQKVLRRIRDRRLLTEDEFWTAVDLQDAARAGSIVAWDEVDFHGDDEVDE